MNPFSKSLRVLFWFAIACSLAACDSKSAVEMSTYEETMESMKTGNIQPGPIRHTALSNDLDARIRKISVVFAEVYPITHEEWLDGFQRDTLPENEVAIWEHMASAYTKFLESNKVYVSERKEAFGLLLVRSGTTDMEPSFSELKVLTSEQARNVIAHYEAAPKPITYQKEN